MRSERNEKKQMEPLFPRLQINDTKEVYSRAPPRDKMAIRQESVSMLPLPLSNDIGLKPSGSQNHVVYPQPRKSGSSLGCSLSKSQEMSEDHNSYSSRSEIQMLKAVDYQNVSSIRPSKMVADCNLFRPFSSYNSDNSSLKTSKDDKFIRLPKFSELNRTLESGGIEDKLGKEKQMISLRVHHGNRTHDNHKISQTGEGNAETPTLLISMKSLPDVAAEYSTKSSFGTRAPVYQSRYDQQFNDKNRLSDPCERAYVVGRTSQENTALSDGILDKLAKKRSHSKLESCFSRDNEENSHNLRMNESVNECCSRDDDVEVGEADRGVSISGALMVDSNSNSDSIISPDDVADIIGPKLFWQVRKTIAHQQRIFAVQVFELHRVIKVQRLFARLPEILSEEMLHICKHSTNSSETTYSVMKPKEDSQRPNSRPETSHPNLPLRCDARKKGHNTTPRYIPGPCTTRSSTFSPFSPPLDLGSLYFQPGNQCIIPVRPPFYASYGVPRLSVIDRDFMMSTLSIKPSGRHSAYMQPSTIPVVETSNSSKSLPASKGSDINESIVGSPPANRVPGEALPLFPIGPPSQSSYKEIPRNNAEMQGTQVIKPIPHNPKLACESAARIFKSLQEERQKLK